MTAGCCLRLLSAPCCGPACSGMTPLASLWTAVQLPAVFCVPEALSRPSNCPPAALPLLSRTATSPLTSSHLHLVFAVPALPLRHWQVRVRYTFDRYSQGKNVTDIAPGEWSAPIHALGVCLPLPYAALPETASNGLSPSSCLHQAPAFPLHA